MQKTGPSAGKPGIPGGGHHLLQGRLPRSWRPGGCGVQRRADRGELGAPGGADSSQSHHYRPFGGRPLPAKGSSHTPMTRQAADKALRQTCAQLGLEGVSTHSFRRSLATAAVRRGVALNVVQQITGHKSLGSLGHYLEADETEVLAAIVGDD